MCQTWKVATEPMTTDRERHLDYEQKGRDDYRLDRMENAPFSSIGGLDIRQSIETVTWPSYVPIDARGDYLAGYLAQAAEDLGPDWQTCEFSWQPAIEISRD